MRRIRKAAISLVLTAVMLCMALPAHASETAVKPTVDTHPAIIAKALLEDPGEPVQLDAPGVSIDGIRAMRDIIQAYVDAMSETSSTPTVLTAIGHSGKADQYVRFRLRDNGGAIDDEVMASLRAKAGNTVKSINTFIRLSAEYDKDAAQAGLTQSNHPATAVGALLEGKAVCMGYANAFTILASQAGLKTVKLRGRLPDGTLHVINAVDQNGRYLIVDVTGNDKDKKPDRYLLVTLEEYIKSTGFTPMIDLGTAFAVKYAA